MFRLAILLLATSGCCFAQQGRGGQIKIPEDENQIDSTTTPKPTTEKRTTTAKPTTEKRTTTPKPTTQAKKILSSEEIIDLVNKYRAKLVKEEIPEAEVMFEVENDDSLKDYAKSLVHCKPVEIPNEYSYFSFGLHYKTGSELVETALSHYMFNVEQHHLPLNPTYATAANIFYYKSTRAYCFMRLKSCLVRTNVWHNKVACVFNNRPDAREQLYIPNSRGEESGKGCAGNDAVCQLAINNPASWCNRKNGLCVAAEGVTFPPKLSAPRTVRTTKRPTAPPTTTPFTYPPTTTTTTTRTTTTTPTTTTTTTTTSTTTTTTKAANPITKELADMIVLMHNNRRMMVAMGTIENLPTNKNLDKAANIKELRYDDSLAAQAQVVASSCSIQKGIPRSTVNIHEYGQNIFSLPVFIPLKDAVESVIREWFSGIHSKAINSNMLFSGIQEAELHSATQIIWANHEAVGCGSHVCGQKRVVVCRYSPGGNIIGQYIYQKGTPCSACTHGCRKSLCIVPYYG